MKVFIQQLHSCFWKVWNFIPCSLWMFCQVPAAYTEIVLLLVPARLGEAQKPHANCLKALILHALSIRVHSQTRIPYLYRLVR